jgi:hypothetical protein
LRPLSALVIVSWLLAVQLAAVVVPLVRLM